MQIIRPLIAGGFGNSMRGDQGWIPLTWGKMAPAAVYVKFNGINARSGGREGGGDRDSSGDHFQR